MCDLNTGKLLIEPAQGKDAPRWGFIMLYMYYERAILGKITTKTSYTNFFVMDLVKNT